MRHLSVLTLMFMVFIMACDRDQAPESEGQVSTSVSPAATDVPAEASATAATPIQAGDVPVEATQWLRQHAIPFDTADAGNSFDDLQPLKEMIGDARIVSLGEATHGTREFFQMKHRILEFLVKEMGFTTFGIEATWPESALINDYVHTGQGDPAALLAGLYFWTWNTEEVLEMIQWMRRHNENPGDTPKVSFFGFDMQFPKMAMENVVGYLTEIDPEAAQRARVSYDCFQPFVSQPLSYGTAGEAVRLECRTGMQTVYDELAARRDELSARSTPERFAWALQSARVALQGEWSLAARNERSGQEGSARRDQAMAENVGWLLDQAGPDAKIVLWAHNGHVRNEPGWMGSHLRERYGEQMVIVGFDFYAGEFTAVAWKNGQLAGGLRTHRVDAPPSGSYEAYFHSAGMPRMVLDLRGIDGGNSATSWLAGPRMMRSIGAAYDDATPANYLYPARLPKEYDVIVYFENTTPSRLLHMRR